MDEALKPLRHIELTDEQLRTGHCAVMDWSSFSTLADPRIAELLSKPFGGRDLRLALLASREPELCDILVRLIVYDCVILDGTSGVPEVFNRTVGRLPVVAAVFPQSLYSSAIDSAERFVHELRRIGVPEERLSANEWFQSDLKNRLDKIAEHRNLGSLPSSNASLEQTVFYIQLAQELDLPVFLSYSKRNLVSKFRQFLMDEAFPFVAEKIDSAMRDQTKIAIAEAAADVSIDVPPLFEMVLRTSVQRKVSLLDAVLEIRESPEAQEFRDLLAGVQRALAVPGRAGRLEAERQIAPLTKAARTWAEGATPGEGAHTLTATLSAIPKIGWLADLFGLKSLPYTIPRLTNPPKGLIFVAHWFQAWPTGGPSQDAARLRFLRKIAP